MENTDSLRHQTLTRYITPMREGGSLPLLGEADDEFKYVVKMRGAGHGAKALIAELIGGMVARQAGLRVPELVFLDIDEDFGRTEPDEEVQDLLRASRGLNLGLHYLSGAFTMDPWVNPADDLLASRIVWLDAFLTNVDRTARNTNMLVRHGDELWLIDHGASLYFHHSMANVDHAALTPFPFIKDHALLRKASRLEQVDAEMHSRLTPEFFRRVVDTIPDQWLVSDDSRYTPDELRNIYFTFLDTRLRESRIFVEHANEARRNALV